MVILISGPMASGKSTVARLLASRFGRGAYIEGDQFRRAVVGGREEMGPDASDEARRQLGTRYRAAAALTDLYVDAGFSVVVEDVIAGRDLEAMTTMIRSRPLHVFVLLPSRSVDMDPELYAEFQHRTPRLGTWLDTTDHLPAETVAAILDQVPSEHAQ